jgi:hypothetical protein
MLRIRGWRPCPEGAKVTWGFPPWRADGAAVARDRRVIASLDVISRATVKIHLVAGEPGQGHSSRAALYWTVWHCQA